MLDKQPRIGNYTIHEGTRNPFCSCEKRCEIPPTKQSDNHIRMPHPGYNWNTGIKCPTFKKAFPELTKKLQIQLLKEFTPSMWNPETKTIPSYQSEVENLFNSLKSFGIEVNTTFHTTRKEIDDSIVWINRPLEGMFFLKKDTHFRFQAKLVMKESSEVSFLLRETPCCVDIQNVDKDIKEFIRLLLIDIIHIKKENGEEEFLWFEEESNTFTKSNKLPKTTLPYSFEIFQRARKMSGNKREYTKKIFGL